MKGLCVEEAQNAAGGLCLLWHEELDVTMLTKNSSVIHAYINHEVLPSKWLLTCVYGPPYYNLKKHFWDKLNEMADNINEPGALIGDFNEVMSQNEKLGGRHTGSTSRKYLENFIEYSRCIDLGFVGNLYTWRNKREGLAHIRQRLDRALANERWRTDFPRAGVEHLPASHSGHNPILLRLWSKATLRSKPFRFEAMWTRSEEIKVVIKKAWSERTKGSKQFHLSVKIKIAKRELKQWNKNSFGHYDTKINMIQ